MLILFCSIYSIRGVCDLLTNGPDSEMHRISLFVNNAIEGLGIDCLPNSYDFLIERDRVIDWEDSVNYSGLRPFSYQLCAQLGWFHSSNSRFQPFGSSFNAHWFYISCKDVFGEGLVVKYG